MIRVIVSVVVSVITPTLILNSLFHFHYNILLMILKLILLRCYFILFLPITYKLKLGY